MCLPVLSYQVLLSPELPGCCPSHELLGPNPKLPGVASVLSYQAVAPVLSYQDVAPVLSYQC